MSPAALGVTRGSPWLAGLRVALAEAALLQLQARANCSRGTVARGLVQRTRVVRQGVLLRTSMAGWVCCQSHAAPATREQATGS